MKWLDLLIQQQNNRNLWRVAGYLWFFLYVGTIIFFVLQRVSTQAQKRRGRREKGERIDLFFGKFLFLIS
jgi:hypothetical protein